MYHSISPKHTAMNESHLYYSRFRGFCPTGMYMPPSVPTGSLESTSVK